MVGRIVYQRDGALARVTLAHPPKLNAMSRSMWRELRAVFMGIAQEPDVRCVWVQGASGNFCAGGDIAEYPEFRFAPQTLHDFHEFDVWGGLQAILDCKVPVLAQIEGHCMGAGLEIASCCDLRYAASTARFGAPIARLGFPMAEREAALVTGAVGDTTARAMLLAAAVFDAPHMARHDFLTGVLAPEDLQRHCHLVVDTVLGLSPMATQAHKRQFRALKQAGAGVEYAKEATKVIAVERTPDPLAPYAYAAHAEHREGIAAFLAKRKPQF